MKRTYKTILTAIITAALFASMAGCNMDKQTKQAVSDINSVISGISKTAGESGSDKKDDSTTNQAEESINVTPDDDQRKDKIVSEVSLDETETIDPEVTQIETSDVETSNSHAEETSKQNSVVQEPENSKNNQKEASAKETSKTETSKADTGRQETSKAEVSKAEVSKVETSKQEVSKTETSRQETSKAETSRTETSRQETSKAETSKQESSREEASKQETSQQNPVKPVITKKSIEKIFLTAPVNGGEYRFVTMDVYPAGADISSLKVTVTPLGKNIKVTREIDGVQCGLADDSYRITYDLEPYAQDTWITIRVTDGNINKEVKTEVRAKRTASAAYYTPYDPEQIVKDFRAYGESKGMIWDDTMYVTWNKDHTEYDYNAAFNFPTCTQTTTDGINLYNEMVDQFTLLNSQTCEDCKEVLKKAKEHPDWYDEETIAYCNQLTKTGNYLQGLTFKICYSYVGYSTNFNKEMYEFYVLYR